MELFNHLNETSSSEEQSTSSEEEEIIYEYQESDTFLNNTNRKEYEKNRNKLFTKDLIKKHIVFDSHNFHTSDFNSSNYKINFSYYDKNKNIKTNYGIYHNVIGFRLISAHIRIPPYNINNTNNIIKYSLLNDLDTIHTIKINPGFYSLNELASVFQTISQSTNSQFVTYSHSQDFTVSYLNNNSTSSSVNKGSIFKFEHSATDFKILWNYDNITRGAAKLFGFVPQDISSSLNIIHSDKIPDLSFHYVDLVIPEIPPIACKKNSSGKNIVERIYLSNNNGDYLHYDKESYDISSEQFFLPISLTGLTIQLHSENNVVYDSNNSDNSFEFEITMVNNKDLLK